jgi:hypothetical protein
VVQIFLANFVDNQLTKKSLLWKVHLRFRKISPLYNYIDHVVNESLLWKVLRFLKIPPLENFTDQVVSKSLLW